MTRRRIERFLSAFASELGRPARVFVTGASAVALWGRSRPSVDIDLGVELLGGGQRADWDVVQGAVDRTVRLTGIPANVAEEIDRWGMITLLDYKRSSRLYKRWGSVEVRLLDPANWAIGKLTRYLDSDVRDLVNVLRTRRVSPATAARLWGLALRASPASTTQFQFREHVERFLTEHGPRIWGAGFNPQRVTRAFHVAARIARPARPLKA